MPREPLDLNHVQRDRAVGALLASAAGDALGAGYELRPRIPADEPVGMIGGGLGPFAPGAWTDDTAMALAIAELAATGTDLCYERPQDDLVRRWAWWARTAKDIGVQTSSVLSSAPAATITARDARRAATAWHESTGRSAGNGSLMRTAPVALLYLDDDYKLTLAARKVSDLTHAAPDAADACVLWTQAIRHAVLAGSPDVRIGLGHIPAGRRQVWEARIAEAERLRPADFAGANGWVVAAFQAAWSAIVSTPVPADDPAAGVFAADHLRLALEAAVRGGGNTDTVAAIAGGLLGAVHGASAVPAPWRRVLKGWPGLNTHTLVNLADKIVNLGEPQHFTYRHVEDKSQPRRHPHDDGVWLGGSTSAQRLPGGVGAVVSLCPVIDGHFPFGVEHLDVRLIDEPGANANLDFVLADTVRAVEQFRAEGTRVFLHDRAAGGRAAAVAALYGARRAGIAVEQALAGVCAVLPEAEPNDELRAALDRLTEGGHR